MRTIESGLKGYRESRWRQRTNGEKTEIEQMERVRGERIRREMANDK